MYDDCFLLIFGGIFKFKFFGDFCVLDFEIVRVFWIVKDLFLWLFKDVEVCFVLCENK